MSFQRHVHARDNFIGRNILFAVIDKKRLECDGANTPWARKIEAEFARSVFPTASGYELELDLSGFLRGDPETRWNAHKIALETGVLDPNEVRQIEGWNPRVETTPAPDAIQPEVQGDD